MRLQLALVLSIGLLGAGCTNEEGRDKTDTGTATKPDEKGTAGGKTLCDRLGGKEAIGKISKDLVENYVAKDDRINARFAKSDIPRLEKMISDQLGEAAGCPGVKYTGKDMKTAHAGMAISNAEFDAFMDDVKRCLDANGVKAAEREEVVKLLSGMRSEIVEKSAEKP